MNQILIILFLKIMDVYQLPDKIPLQQFKAENK